MNHHSRNDKLSARFGSLPQEAVDGAIEQHRLNSQAIAKVRVNQIDCFEINSLLLTALQLQQFNLVGSDFLTAAPDPVYDRVISNPPFSNQGVANHTMHAYRFLNGAFATALRSNFEPIGSVLFMGETPKTTLHRFLKPGGRLVTLAHHYQLKPSQSDRYFFDWLESKRARFLNLGAAFKNGDCEASATLRVQPAGRSVPKGLRHRQTSTPLQLIQIDKL